MLQIIYIYTYMCICYAKVARSPIPETSEQTVYMNRTRGLEKKRIYEKKIIIAKRQQQQAHKH